FRRCSGRHRRPMLGILFAIAAQMASPLLPMATAQTVDSAAIPAEVMAAVNINTADREELSSSLSGVGASKAEAIVRYREQFGPFESVDELSEVTGIGASTVERNRERIRLQ
ncbi:unnamed protein product, partial [Ectocarpus sp. 12 AP-2014]